MEFMKSEKFKLISKKRYMIVAKNSELKNRHGMKPSKYACLFNMEMQAAATIFVVNLKRITKLIESKQVKIAQKSRCKIEIFNFTTGFFILIP